MGACASRRIGSIRAYRICVQIYPEILSDEDPIAGSFSANTGTVLTSKS